MEDIYATVVEKKNIDNNRNIFIPSKLIKLKDEEKLIGEDDVEYYLINEDGKDNYIFFFIEKEKLEQIYGDNFKEKYFEDIKKYSILKEKDNVELLYKDKDKNEILSIDDFANFFVSHLNNEEKEDFNIKNLYKKLKSNVFMQDDAIKKITVALSLHYLDIEEKQKVNIIIDGDKATGKSTIINTLRDNMPVDVIVEDLGDENFSFDYLFLSLYNNKDISSCPILVLDNADKLLLNTDLAVADEATNIIKNLMLGVDYMLKTSSGAVSYCTNDFVIIVVGDFKKRIRCGVNNFVEGVPEKLSRLTNYDIKMNPLTREMVYAKLLSSENGTFKHFTNYISSIGININANEKLIDKIVDEVMKSNMHELDKIVEKCFEDILFEIYTSDSKFSELTINQKVLKNNKKYILK